MSQHATTGTTVMPMSNYDLIISNDSVRAPIEHYNQETNTKDNNLFIDNSHAGNIVFY